MPNDLNYEKEMLDFWKSHDINNKLKEKNKKNKPFYFLQGPPYTSGKIHLGHAWNNTMKDFIIRYKKMKSCTKAATERRDASWPR